MKKLIKDPEAYFLLGLLGLIIAIPSENIYINLFLIPIFFIMQIFGIIFMIKKHINKKKTVNQEVRNTVDTSYIKTDVSIWMCLLAIFGSLLAVVASLVLLVFLHKGNLDLFRYFIIATSCIHAIIVVISSIAFFKILANKKEV